ncbi:MAG TPA: hypothetical protein ENH01_00620 [Nitrospirae bacterium]|nr:hypothetical protein [Nitrospirota bacterium]
MVIVHADVNKMALLMSESDIAFTAFGITLFELAYMGVPSVVIANYREDKEDMAAYDKLGIGIPLGFHEEIDGNNIRNAVESFLHKRELLNEMSKTGKTLVDGNGVERIVNIIENIGVGDVCRSRQ